MSIENGGITGSNNKRDSLEKPESREGKIRGTIKNWNAEKGFGFLRLSDGRNVFCHVSELCEHIRPVRGQIPDINTPVNVKKVNQGERGLAAEEVECDECAVSEQWELQPTGPEVFGVRELQPVCVNKKNVSSYRSTIPREEVEKANELFKLAKRKESLWNRSVIYDDFFQEFGEPQNVRVENSNKIILSYPFGEKTVDADSAFNSGRWEVSPSGLWKEDDGIIEAEYIFPDLPGVKAWRTIAYLNIHPSLNKAFDLLPEDLQQEILAKVKEKILPPERIAEMCFNDFLNEGYKMKQISKLREDIRLLQSPGEMTLESRNYKTQEEVTGSYGDETWGTGRYIDVQRTAWYLKTGAKKREHYTWAGEYVGGHDFLISIPEEGETPEQIRDKVLSQKIQQLKSEFDRAKRMHPPSSDARLYTLKSEEWSKQYEIRWDQMQKELESQWESEDAKLLAEIKKSWDQYENVVKDLLSAREEVRQVETLASASLVTLEYNARPDWGDIAYDTVEKMQQKVTALRAYALKLNERISNAITAREQEDKNNKAVKEQEEIQKDERENADIEQFGTTGRLLDIARSLATEAKKKLGLTRAYALFESTNSAPYGRARRQADIEYALGNMPYQDAGSFFSFSRARDVDEVLYAVTKLLEGTDVSVKTSKPDKSLPESTVEELPQLNQPDKKGWWSHELPNGNIHSERLNKVDKVAYESGERVNVRCSSCSNNPLVGYLQK